jgi:hypothetical protein
MNQIKHDCTLELKEHDGYRIESFTYLSPGNEVGKLPRYMFSNFSAHCLLPLVAAMMFDFKIIILATTPELLGQTAFGILGLS